MPDWSLWPTITVAGLAVLGIVFAAGLWAGAVSADREPFKNFMIEIKEKLGIILDRLPPPRIISSNNPGSIEQIRNQDNQKTVRSKHGQSPTLLIFLIE